MSENAQAQWAGPHDGGRHALTMQEQLLDAGGPERIFGEPITAAGQTIITAGETITVFGYGHGGGGTTTAGNSEGGSGGGGGGYTLARPVAVIIIGERGTRAEPIMDVPKVAIAMFTAGAAIVASLARIWRHSRA